MVLLKKQKVLKPLRFQDFYCLVLTKKMQNSTRIPPPFSARNPAKRIRAESEEIPTIAQFSAKPETERWWEFLSWSECNYRT